MPKNRTSRGPASGFSFRWGIPILDDLPFTVLYHFLLDHYAALGVDPLEMMFIIHLSQFRHETPSGKAEPGLPTIAEKMGYKDEQQVRRLKHRLIQKGLLRVTPRPGLPDIYDVAPFAAAAFALWQQDHTTPLQSDTPIQNDRGMHPDTPPPIQNDRGPLSEMRAEKESNQKIKTEDSNVLTTDTAGPSLATVLSQFGTTWALALGEAATLCRAQGWTPTELGTQLARRPERTVLARVRALAREAGLA